MAVTKVAAFIRGPPESIEQGFGSTPEADFAAALMYLRNQIQEPLPFSYIAPLYLPFFLVHALPGRSLIISGIGEPTVTVRHSTIPSLVQIRSQLRSIEELKQVPRLLGELIQAFEKPPKDLIVIRNAMLPTMIETLQTLVDPSIPFPGEEVCIRSQLSNKEIHDVGILFRNERARMEECLTQLNQLEILLNEYSQEQLHILDTRRDRLTSGASLRWEATPTEEAPKRAYEIDAPILDLSAEKTRISLELSELMSELEKTLGISSEQCRRLISQIQAKPTETEWHLANVRNRIIQLRTTIQDFHKDIQEALNEIKTKAEKLQEVKNKWGWREPKPRIEKPSPLVRPAFPHGTLEYSKPTEARSTEDPLKELTMIRDAIIQLHLDLQKTIKTLRGTIKQEYARFETISAPADPLQGYLPLMRLLIPVYVVKLGDGEGKYGVIPPLQIKETVFSEYNVDVFDEVFGEQLIQLLRTEIRSKFQFRQRLDNQGRERNWITRPFSTEHIQRGTRQFANYGLIDRITRENLADFWSNIIS